VVVAATVAVDPVAAAMVDLLLVVVATVVVATVVAATVVARPLVAVAERAAVAALHCRAVAGRVPGWGWEWAAAVRALA